MAPAVLLREERAHDLDLAPKEGAIVGDKVDIIWTEGMILSLDAGK